MEQILKYGTVKKAVKFNVNGSGRYDIYKAHSDGYETREFILCNDKHDTSDQYEGHYNPNCSACWLNYAHTIDKHNKSINQ